MSRAQRYRAKMLRGLVRALEDEEAHVRRYRRIGNACAFSGGIVLTIAIFAGWGAREIEGWWLVLSGLVAGVLIGLGVFYLSSVEQWPVTREFLDAEAIRKAAGSGEP